MFPGTKTQQHGGYFVIFAAFFQASLPPPKAHHFTSALFFFFRSISLHVLQLTRAPRNCSVPPKRSNDLQLETFMKLNKNRQGINNGLPINNNYLVIQCKVPFLGVVSLRDPFKWFFVTSNVWGGQKVTLNHLVHNTHLKEQPSNHIHIITSLFWKNNILHVEGFKT